VSPNYGICSILPDDIDIATDKIFYKVKISDLPDSLRKGKDKWFLLLNMNYQGKILLSGKPVLKRILGR